MTMSRNSSVSGGPSELVDKKSYIKIDPIGKLHIIYSLDSGNSKTDIARIYGVHPKTITYIYSQRELILKKYEHKYNHLKEVRLLNLDQTLLDWFKAQISEDVTENDLLHKAQELTQHLNEEFIHAKDWLLDFQRRHNIIKYISEAWHNGDTVDEWRRIMTKVDSDKLYICGTCAIYHSLFLDPYAAGEHPDDYMSVLFVAHVSGSYKRKLAIVGKEQLNADSNLGSLPANYYANNCYINQHALVSYLQEWDDELSSEGRTVFLAITIRNSNLMKMQFKNIKIIPIGSEFLSKSLQKIVECFKYHYKRQQIMKKIEHGNYLYLDLLDYINLISLAWFNVPDFYIKQVFNPPTEGSLHLRPVDACDGNHSLLHWCETYNIPLDMQLYAPYLEQYIFCDKDLKSIDFEGRSEVFEPNISAHPNSSMEAYQAMKRLLSYLQGERASEHVLQSAKLLENHLEYGTLLEIHNVIARNNSE